MRKEWLVWFLSRLPSARPYSHISMRKTFPQNTEIERDENYYRSHSLS